MLSSQHSESYSKQGHCGRLGYRGNYCLVEVSIVGHVYSGLVADRVEIT
jgi:hypothetical protein